MATSTLTFEETMSERRFNQCLLEAVDETLSSLGTSSKHTIYYHLKKSFNISKQDVPFKIEAFSQAMEEIFGFGAKFLEVLIMQKLVRKLGLSMKDRFSRRHKFSISIELAKQYFTKKPIEQMHNPFNQRRSLLKINNYYDPPNARSQMRVKVNSELKLMVNEI